MQTLLSAKTFLSSKYYGSMLMYYVNCYTFIEEPE